MVNITKQPSRSPPPSPTVRSSCLVPSRRPQLSSAVSLLSLIIIYINISKFETVHNSLILSPSGYTHKKEYNCVDGSIIEKGKDNSLELRILVTGGAGFIGMHTSIQLKKLGHHVVAYDAIKPLYSANLTRLRIKKLEINGVDFVKGDVCNSTHLKSTMEYHRIDRIIHLAAFPGVRNSVAYPTEYIDNNVKCFVVLLESLVAKNLTNVPLIYASSSSVYGLNEKAPFSEKDDVSNPTSMYAITKRFNELIAQTYYNLYGLNSVGLRFFTVYGPWGRPDMAYYTFVDKILRNQTIEVYNYGNNVRDFTYIDDIVDGIIASLFIKTKTPEIINLGNSKQVELIEFIKIIETSLDKKALLDYVEMQRGDVPLTHSDISKARCFLKYDPSKSIHDGIPSFVDWFLAENGGQYAEQRSL